MGQTLTISELDAATTEWIQQEAKRTGASVETVVRHLIYRGIAIERQKTQQQRYHDLDALAGTWSAEEEAEFRQAIQDFERIDSTVWP